MLPALAPQTMSTVVDVFATMKLIDLSTGDHIFNNVPCSGALAGQIAEWQLLDEKKDTGPNWQYGTRIGHDSVPC